MKIDPKRLEGFQSNTIPIRAMDPITKRWGTYEVVQLDKESLIEWLDGRSIEYVKDVVGILLGHGILR